MLAVGIVLVVVGLACASGYIPAKRMGLGKASLFWFLIAAIFVVVGIQVIARS